jgi:hypothetical protein
MGLPPNLMAMLADHASARLMRGSPPSAVPPRSPPFVRRLVLFQGLQRDQAVIASVRESENGTLALVQRPAQLYELLSMEPFIRFQLLLEPQHLAGKIGRLGHKEYLPAPKRDDITRREPLAF